MCGSQRPPMGADAVTRYRVSLRSTDSDHTFHRYIRVLGPRDMAHQMDELRVEHPGYDVGSPVPA